MSEEKNLLIRQAVFFLFIILFSSCAPTPTPTKKQNSLVSEFPNILNLTGTPDSLDDRSVFAFSDLGAWHGYALPDENNREFFGSFIGPYIMTQDNGIWLGDCLSKMEIIDLETSKEINLEEAEIIERNSYPNQLKQILQTKNPKLRIETTLIFASNRTGLMSLDIQNKSSENLKLSVHWRGQSFLDEVSFTTEQQAIKIDFGKNKNIAWISSLKANESIVTTNGKQFKIQTNPFELSPGASWNSHLTQSFCFNEEEQKKEIVLLNELSKNPASVYRSNATRWNENIEKVTNYLKPEFNTTAHQNIVVKCLQTLTTNWKSAAGFFKYDGLFPSYNYEWFNGFWSWDSWKHAVAIAHYDTELAQNQIKAMYHFQNEDGMIADCVYRDTIIENHNWRDTKPPLSAWAIWEVFQKSKDQEFLEELFPKLEKYHNWWYKFRDFNKNGLCEYGSTDASLIAAKWESGMDNAIRFDEVKIVSNGPHGGTMNFESVDLNSYLCLEKNYLAKIAKQFGALEKSEKYLKDAESLKKQIQEKFYDKDTGWFYDLNLETNALVQVMGPEGWIPLWTEIATEEQAEKVRTTMLDSSKFATHIPFPTVTADHPKFKPMNGYWRGPVWLDQAYFAIEGLRIYGYEKEALNFSTQLFDRLEGLKNADGPIRENYHPITGKGLESNHFSWSAAHLLMLLMEE